MVWYQQQGMNREVLQNLPNIHSVTTLQIRIGGELGRIASVMCIARFLAAVVSPKATAITREDRRQRAIFDYSLCFGGPIIIAGCEIIYQPVRFALVRTLGCEAVHSNTWPTLVLWLIWPPIFATIGVLYSSKSFLPNLVRKQSIDWPKIRLHNLSTDQAST